MQNFTITLTAEELNAVGAALSDRPFKEVAGLLGKINQQVLKQNTPPAPVEAPAGE
jgi:hypothetical protein